MLRIETPEFCVTQCDFRTECTAALLAVSLEKTQLRQDESTTAKMNDDTKSIAAAMLYCAFDVQRSGDTIILDNARHVAWGTRVESRIVGLQRAANLNLTAAK